MNGSFILRKGEKVQAIADKSEGEEGWEGQTRTKKESKMDFMGNTKL